MTLRQLEKTIADLPPDQFSKFREWFLAFDAEKWDGQLEGDVAAGRLDQMADEAIDDHQAGKSNRIFGWNYEQDSSPRIEPTHP